MPRDLHAVAEVLRRRPAVEALPHLAETITTILGPSPNLSLYDACKLGSTELIDWIWATSSSCDQNSTLGWSLCNFLQSDKHYYKWQFSQCVEYSAKHGDLKLVEWLFSHFTECQVSPAAISAAVRNGHLPVLKFLLNHDFGVHGTEDEEPATKMRRVETGSIDVRARIRVDWGFCTVEEALSEGHLEVAQWLYENSPKSEDDHDDAAIEGIVSEALDIGATAFAESVVPEGANVLDYAMSCNRVEVIERLIDGGYFEQEDFSAVIAKLARTDRLDLIERISTQQKKFPSHWRNIDLIRTLSAACRNGNMAVLQWLVEHPMGVDLIEKERKSVGVTGLLCRAAEGEHTNVMEYLTDEGIDGEYRSALFDAIREGILNSVEWLVEHFPVAEKIPNYSVMDEAAKLGHLEILKKLHSMDTFVPGWGPIRTSKRKRGARGDSETISTIVVTATGNNSQVLKGVFNYQTNFRPTDPMDHAAANGHLEVVQWLHNNHPEGCSSAAIDDAAANGHMEVVQWLQEIRPEECTKRAMDDAASNGNLDMVKWLHVNMKAGCTTAAMDCAAGNGHLEMLKWLHTNRSEGCTAKALENAIGGGHLQVARWLQLRYPEFSPAEVNICPDVVNKFESFLFLHTHYAHIVQKIRSGRTPHNPLIFCYEIIAWLHKSYPSPE